MKPAIVMAAALLGSATSAQAHRLDEYLQAVTIAVGRDRMQAQIRLTPGVAVYPIIVRSIDTDHDGMISRAEQQAYVSRVMLELSFAIDGAPLPVHIASWAFPDAAHMAEGRGDIVIDVDAALPAGVSQRKLTLENRHQRQISVYLVNALVPADTAIRIAAQRRNTQQSFYELDFTGRNVEPSRDAPVLSSMSTSRSMTVAAFGVAALLLVGRRRSASRSPAHAGGDMHDAIR